MLRWTVVLVGGMGLLAPLVACKKAATKEAPPQTASKATPSRRDVTLRGVSPDAFDCLSVAPIASMEAMFGAGIEVQETSFEAPPGVARQCAFSRKVEEKLEMWSYDVDCRDSAHQDARDRMKQHEASAGDAGVGKLAIGKGALDHHGVALLFIDDDTPCHVRVLGLDADRRQQLARLLVKKLSPDTAPIRLNRGNLQRAAR